MKRSILTEKIARRGYHVSQEYSIDPLERLSVSDAMAPAVISVPASLPIKDLMLKYFLGGPSQKHQGYPVVDDEGRLMGVVTKSDLLDEWMATMLSGVDPRTAEPGAIITYDLVVREPITAFSWESCRTAAERMARMGVGRLPVVHSDDPMHVVGIITRSDLLKSRARQADEEQRRERFLGKSFAFPGFGSTVKPT
jgi:CBS domain-containing protein